MAALGYVQMKTVLVHTGILEMEHSMASGVVNQGETTSLQGYCSKAEPKQISHLSNKQPSAFFTRNSSVISRRDSAIQMGCFPPDAQGLVCSSLLPLVYLTCTFAASLIPTSLSFRIIAVLLTGPECQKQARMAYEPTASLSTPSPQNLHTATHCLFPISIRRQSNALIVAISPGPVERYQFPQLSLSCEYLLIHHLASS